MCDTSAALDHMESVLQVVGQHVVAPTLMQDAVSLLRVSRSAHGSLATVRALAWAGHPSFHLGDPQVSVAEVDAALATLPGRAVGVRRWQVLSRLGTRTSLSSKLCCWPIACLALKPQYVAVLRGAPQLARAAEGMICIWMRSNLFRELPDEDSWRHGAPNGELGSRVHVLGVVSGGGLLLVRHQLLTLDNCRGSPDSPVGLEHSPQAVLAPSWKALESFLGRVAPKWLAELKEGLGCTASANSAAHDTSPAGADVATQLSQEAISDFDSDDEATAWSGKGDNALWVEILRPESIFAAADAFITAFGWILLPEESTT
ncbi:unnamed protein product [Polarella glacialis]|uniref:Uncharacterized protein n=1 Tax=Polarella glacialis TaxID=89957 RepID=A0A813LPH6_POLGL|nr:unnamed protein product [Polarella glacialis]CAE8734634.1 unnamed protein product [Polarella glacialis]